MDALPILLFKQLYFTNKLSIYQNSYGGITYLIFFKIFTKNKNFVPGVGVGYYIARCFSINKLIRKSLSIPTRKQINLLASVLCPEWGSNPHPLRDTILSRTRIPIPPSGQYYIFNPSIISFLNYNTRGLGRNRTAV